jgi:hypothetical protein
MSSASKPTDDTDYREVLALRPPEVPPWPTQPRRTASSEERGTLLDMIGIAASAEPTDIAHHEQEYLAEAYVPARR